MSTELEQRLQRLVPEVDLDLARAEQRARQQRAAHTAQRRRVLIGAGAAAASAVVIAATGLTLRDRSGGADDREVGDVVAGPAQTKATSTEQDGVKVTVTAPDEAVAGTRLWFDVVVRNVGEVPVIWEAGGCAIPVQAFVGPSPTVAADQLSSGRDGPRWDGHVDGLGAWLAEHNSLSTTQSHQPADLTGTREIVCNSDSRAATIEPGDELRYGGSVELRVPPGDLPDGGRYELIVDFQPYTAAAIDIGSIGDPLPLVEVRSPLALTDDAERTSGNSDAAIAAFADDPRLADWITSTEIPDRPDLVQDFTTELSWWRGGWELWVDAHWEDNRLLRMRYDPGRDEVVDVRTVYLGKSPDDEPGRVAVTGEEPDEIL